LKRFQKRVQTESFIILRISELILLRDLFVITIRKNNTVKEIFLSSYHFGSVEWKSGTGIIDPRLWESEEQAVSPSYLTRRYTVRMANGPATTNLAVEQMIPDVLDNMEDREIAGVIGSILLTKKSKKRIEL
jgi:hypothetical protein